MFELSNWIEKDENSDTPKHLYTAQILSKTEGNRVIIRDLSVLLTFSIFMCGGRTCNNSLNGTLQGLYNVVMQSKLD